MPPSDSPEPRIASGWRGLPALVKDALGLGLDYLPGLEERMGHIRLTTLIGIVVVLPFALLNLFVYGMVLLGIVELFAVLCLLIPAAVLGRVPARIVLAETLVALSAVVILIPLMVLGGIGGTGIFWVYTAPFLFFFLKGQRKGWWYSLLFIALSAACLLGMVPRLELAYPYSRVIATHFLVSLCFYTLVAAAFNKLRSTFEQQLQRRVEEKTADAKILLGQLQYLATHDALTDLPNQTLLVEGLQAAIDLAGHAGQGLLVSHLRVERLFELTNILGAATGDRLVRRIAEHLRREIGENGMLARVHRDEFVIVRHLEWPAPDPTSFDRCLADLQFTSRQDEYSLYLEFSRGVALYPDHAAEARTLLNKAEQALLLARKAHQQSLVYDQRQEETFVRHHLLFGRLREAIFGHHLQLHFQPQIELETGRIIGAEALTRWLDPVNGPVPPYQFIPVAEESGLIRLLTQWVINQCVKECARWRREGLALDVSINLSAMNLLDPELRQTLGLALTEADLPPRSIVLEITESCFMNSPERALAMVRALHGDGFRLSIDDFGTGFSSLSYLKSLPIDELKIDQNFVRNLLESPGDQAIVSSTIDLAHNFRLSVVAEGVEDATTAAWLRARGCDVGQGYCFAKPMPIDAFLALVRANRSGPDPQGGSDHADHPSQ